MEFLGEKVMWGKNDFRFDPIFDPNDVLSVMREHSEVIFSFWSKKFSDNLPPDVVSCIRGYSMLSGFRGSDERCVSVFDSLFFSSYSSTSSITASSG